MSLQNVRYKNYLEQQRELEKKRAAVNQQLVACEEEIATLQREYSKKCDHPARILTFPVCSVCYDLVTKALATK